MRRLNTLERQRAWRWRYIAAFAAARACAWDSLQVRSSVRPFGGGPLFREVTGLLYSSVPRAYSVPSPAVGSYPALPPLRRRLASFLSCCRQCQLSRVFPSPLYAARDPHHLRAFYLLPTLCSRGILRAYFTCRRLRFRRNHEETTPGFRSPLFYTIFRAILDS